MVRNSGLLIHPKGRRRGILPRGIIEQSSRGGDAPATTKGTRYLSTLRYLVPFVVGMMLWAPLAVWAADEGDAASEATFEEASKPNYLIFKMMIVNPSEKFKQTYPMKAYLPEEVLPEHILERDGLQIAYDANKKTYYVTEEVELDPGQSVIKSIQIKDVWFVPVERMDTVSQEAQELFEKLKSTRFESKARLLMNNIETLLLQIFESQMDKTVTPEEHISVFRDNKDKLRDVEMDLMAMRRFVVSTGGELGPGFGKEGGGMWSFLSGADSGLGKAGGAIPAGMVWRIIFLIVSFTGVMSLVFFWIWQKQLQITDQRRRKAAQKQQGRQDHKEGPKEERLRLGDFLGSNLESAEPPPHPPEKAA